MLNRLRQKTYDLIRSLPLEGDRPNQRALLHKFASLWHEKGVEIIKKTADELGIPLQVKKLQSAREARQSGSGFGVFALVKDGRLLEDHYLSKRRFKTIAEKQMTEE